MSPAIKASLLAGVGGAIPGALLSAAANYLFVGMPADATINAVNHAITGVCRLDHFIGLLDQLVGRPLAVIEFLERDFRRRHVATAAIGAGNGRAVQIIERRAAILALAMPFDAAASRQCSDTFQRCLQQFSTFCWRAKPWAARFQLIESMREQIPAPAAST